MPRSRLDDVMSGDKFGEWMVLDPFVRRGRRTFVLCKCSCGLEKEIRKDSLKKGDSMMCHSCANRIGRNLRHGDNRKSAQSPEYKAWRHMQDRCQDGYKRPQDYFLRGISVCEEWVGEGGFERFLNHIGRRPSNIHSLDRINNDSGYFPGNVRWATPKEQANNRRNSAQV